MTTPWWQINPPSAAADCLPCCPQQTCCFTVPSILVPGRGPGIPGPYADLSTAESRLADWAVDCYMWTYSSSGSPVASASASFSGGVLQMDANDSRSSGAPDNLETKVTSRVYLTVASGLSIAYTLGATYPGSPGPSNYTLQLYADDESTLIDTASGSGARSGTFTPTIPADGYYRIYADVLISSDTGGLYTTTISLTCTPDPACSENCAITPCSIQAAYDDGIGGIGFAVQEECETCSLGCWVQCESIATCDCIDPFPCGEGPFYGTECCASKFEIPCSVTPAYMTTSSQARLVMDGLTAGQNYSATIYFCNYDGGGTLIGISSTTISFTATSSTETTSYVAVPTAPINEYWCVCGCEVLLVA